MFCTHCGTQLPDDSAFCTNCGGRLSIPAAEPAPAPKKPKKAPKVLPIAIAAVLVVAIAVVAVSLLGETPDPWQEAFDRGEAYLEEEEYKDAVKAYLEAIELDPEQPEAYEQLVEAYEALGDYDSARKILKKGIAETDDRKLKKLLSKLDEEAVPDVSQETPGDYAPLVKVFLPTRMEKTVANETGDVWVETYEYDLYGNRVKRLTYRPDGSLYYTYYMEYDTQGRVMRQVSVAADGKEYVTTYAYDSQGMQLQTGFVDRVYTYELDDQGRFSRYQENDETFALYEYQENSRSYTIYRYYADLTLNAYTEVDCDDSGNVLATRLYNASNDLIYLTEYSYNEQNQRVAMLSYQMNSSTYVDTSHAYFYDEYGNCIRDEFTGNYYSSDYVTVYTVEPIEVVASAADRLGQ